MKPVQKVLLSGALVGASIAGGAFGASLIGTASAQTTSTANSSSTTATSGSQPSFPAHGTAAHEDAEKPVTGDAATKAQAAAVASVGSGTAGDVTTDYSGNGYEVTVTKSDGTQVEVHLDSSFNVMTGPGAPGGTNPTGSA
jgi:hypothetical protein